MMERLLRWIAIAIAVAALVDPAVTLSSRTRPRLSLVVENGPSMDLPTTSGISRRASAERTRARLVTDLAPDFDWTAGFDSSSAAVVVIGDRYFENVPHDLPVSTVTVSSPIAPNVRIAGVRAPRAVPPSTAVALEVAVEGTSVAGATTTVVVRSGGAEVGRATHAWTSSPETWRAALDVVPVGTPPFAFDINAEPVAGELTAADNHARTRVGVAPRLRVLVLEGRPSWASAFVRRALEDDPRFDVAGRTKAAPRVVIGTQGSQDPQGSQGSLGSFSFDGFDVVVAGGLDGLSASEISWLDRFMRVRGGAVALFPDTNVGDPIRRELMPASTLRERLLEKPAALMTDGGLPTMQASELLTAEALPADASILARDAASAKAVLWSVERGDGRLFFSGAMDAWRYRAQPGAAFDRFWRSVVSALALSARPAVEVSVSPERAAAGERVQVWARIRRLERERLQDSLAVSARVGTNRPIRLWPAAESGAFTGSFVMDPPSRGDAVDVVVSVANDQASGAAAITIDDTVRERTNVPLAWLAESRRGMNVGPDDLPQLERHLRDSVAAPPAPQTKKPMRSAWWLAPFAACLSGEWWLRRRAGRR